MLSIRATKKLAMLSLIGALAAAPATAQGLGGLLNRALDVVDGDDNGNQQSPPPVPQQLGIMANEQSITLGGYSSSFNTIRGLMSAGDYSEAIAIYSGEKKQSNAGLGNFVSTNDQFLRNAELGVMQFERGQTESAVEHFNLAEADVNQTNSQQRQRGFGGGLNSLRRNVTRLGLNVIGREGLAPYQEQDFEEIIQLNYLTLTYLMEGEYKAFNVTRRAIVAQTIAREIFIEELEKAQTDIESLEDEQGQTSTESVRNAQDNFFTVFSQFDDIASRVPSAYVNPLGYYVNAVVLEIDSIRKPEKRGNARESYRKALELAPSSSVLESAFIELSSAQANDNQSTVHIIFAEGFAPSRQVLTYGLQMDSSVIPIELPVYVPNSSLISSVQAQANTGQSAQLEAVADIEAIVMRSQKDRLPIIWSKVALQAVRSAMMQNAAGSSTTGAVLYGVAEGLQQPDTRSWSSLPARFHIARLKVPNTATQITLSARDAQGAQVKSQTVQIDASSQHVVIYGRAVDGALNASTSAPLWIANP